MKKSGILMMAVMAAVASASAQEVDFDGAKGKAAGRLGAMAGEYSGAGTVEASRPALVPMIEPWNIDSNIPVPSNDAPFMNEEACAILDANFFVQPSKEEAGELLKPCLAALSGKYGAPLKLLPGKSGLDLLVGDAKNPGKDLKEALLVNLKAKAGGQFFGYKVSLFAARARESVNKGWWDDAETVYNAVTEDPSGTAHIIVNGIRDDIESHSVPGVNMTPWDTRPITFAQGM